MQKQVNFFEQHVQWFALGLGGLFLAFMIFKYVMSAPVTVDVGGKVLSPGEVDKITLEGPVDVLKKEIARTELPDIPQQDYVQSFLAAIQGSNEQLALLSPNQVFALRMHGKIGLGEGPEGPITPGGKPVTVLPVLPVATASPFFTHGRSRITFQDPNWIPKPNRINDLPAMIEQDKDWWSGEFVVNAQALAKSFTDAFNAERIENFNLDPQRFLQSAMIDVELWRREILPGNKPGEERLIKILPTNPLRPPYPGANAKDAEIGEFITWSTMNQPEIIAPPFYEWIAGDPWLPPGEDTDLRLVADKEARKAAKAMDVEQRRLQAQQRQQQRIAQQQQRRGPARGVRGAGVVGEDMEMDAEMGTAFINPVGPRSTYRPAPFAPRATVARPGRPGQPAPQVVAIGAQLFDVTTIGDVKIIAHDDTVEPGKTYQYKIRYRVFNPVYKSNAADDKLAKSFAIESKYSDWTKPFKSRPKVEFFIAKIVGQQAEWEVFQWKDGKMSKANVKAAPGDAIGLSGWSVVDLGGSGVKAYSLIMNDAGQLARREPAADAENDRRQQLQEEVELPPAQVGLR